jgi:hypothetical protein
MTSVATGIGVFCAVGLNVAAAFVPQTPPPPNPKPPVQTSAKSTQAEITVTGCLAQGSTATVFILQNAKRDPASATEKGARYVVVPAAEDLSLKAHISHQIRILGVPDGRPQPTPQAGVPLDEKLIPALSAKSLTMVGPSCGPGGGNLGQGDGSGSGGGGYGGGGSIGLGSAGAGLSGLSGHMSSNFGTAGSRFGTGSLGLASTSSVFGGGGSRGPEFDESGDWAPHGYVPGLEDFPESASDQAVEALMTHVARTTATELLGEDVSGLVSGTAATVPIVNPEPGTLLLIASGLLLVVYAGRRREWSAFNRRSAR